VIRISTPPTRLFRGTAIGEVIGKALHSAPRGGPYAGPDIAYRQ